MQIEIEKLYRTRTGRTAWVVGGDPAKGFAVIHDYPHRSPFNSEVIHSVAEGKLWYHRADGRWASPIEESDLDLVAPAEEPLAPPFQIDCIYATKGGWPARVVATACDPAKASPPLSWEDRIAANIAREQKRSLDRTLLGRDDTPARMLLAHEIPVEKPPDYCTEADIAASCAKTLENDEVLQRALSDKNAALYLSADYGRCIDSCEEEKA